jgi:hypothetical protein
VYDVRKERVFRWILRIQQRAFLAQPRLTKFNTPHHVSRSPHHYPSGTSWQSIHHSHLLAYVSTDELYCLQLCINICSSGRRRNRRLPEDPLYTLAGCRSRSGRIIWICRYVKFLNPFPIHLFHFKDLCRSLLRIC